MHKDRLCRWFQLILVATVISPLVVGVGVSAASAGGREKKRCRVLFIGETGAGKSTAINALVGRNVVETSDSATGCTENYSSFHFDRHGISYEFIDSIGLNEVTTGTVDQKVALMKFFRFLKDNQDGFNLIVFCMKQDRLTQQAKATYDVMVKNLYSESEMEPPPVLIFIGGMFVEQLHPQDWCNANRQKFIDAGYDEAPQDVNGLHCVSLPGKSPNKMIEAAYVPIREESISRAWKLVKSNACLDMRPLYRGSIGFVKLGLTLWNMFVSLMEWIPSPFGGNMKDCFNLARVVPSVVANALEHFGFTVDDFSAASISS